MERRNHHQAAKEWRPQRLQQLSRDHAPINARQGFQQASAGEDEGACRPQPPTPAGRLPAEQILCRPDRQPAHHRGTVTGIEPPPPPLSYINFIDYEKTMWKLLRHYGVPEKIISLIRCTFQDMSCRIAHAGQLSERFEVKTGVRQGCLLSPFLFLLVIDRIMKTTTTRRNNGIQWTRTSGQADTMEEVGLDQTHPQEASIQHHTPSPDLEPAGEATVGGETLKMS